MTQMLSNLPTEAAGALISPVAIVVLCVVAGLGTFMLLPSRREAAFRGIGAVMLAAAGAIAAGLLARAGGQRAYFWIFTAIALVAAVRVVTHRRPVYSALYFMLTVFASAGLFVLLWAEFMAAALILIYAGAILVTYVFVIMLASAAQSPDRRTPMEELTECDTVSREPLLASTIGFALMGVLLFVIFDRGGTLPAPAAQPVSGTAQNVGQYLFAHQTLNLELAGVILVVAMVGAIVIARRRVLSGSEEGEQLPQAYPPGVAEDDPHLIPVNGTVRSKE